MQRKNGQNNQTLPSTNRVCPENLKAMSDSTGSPPSSAPGRFIPGLELFRHFQRQRLLGDVVAGISACVVMIPSMIAYARLMGLPI